MDDDKLMSITDSISKKIGEETAATIADDLGKLITENTATQDLIKSQYEKIKQLEDRNEKLVAANGSLLQQIPMGKEVIDKKEESENPKPISWNDVFDKSGNFIH